MQYMAGQTTARIMLIQVLTEQIAEAGADRTKAARKAVSLCIRAIRVNRDMTDIEKQAAIRTFEESLDMLDRIASGSIRGR